MKATTIERESGFALLSTLSIAVFVSVLLILTTNSLLRITDQVVAKKHGLLAQAAARSHNVETIEKLQLDLSEGVPLHEIESPFTILRHGHQPILEVRHRASFGKAEKLLSTLLRIHTPGTVVPPQPDWASLHRNLVSGNSLCRNWKTERKIIPPARISLHTCTKLQSVSESGFFLSANLAIDDMLHIQNTNQLTMRIVTSGSMSINNSIQLQNLRSTSIEIIAGGDIVIENLNVSDVNASSLLIHSATGSVSIHSLNGASEDCNHSAEQLNLSIQAHREISIAEKLLESKMVGCRYPFSAPTWPHLSILGSSNG